MNRKLLFAIIVILFFARLAYGLLFSDFWFPDEKQIYLLGLKFYTTGLWPYFGPDVVYTSSQIPGALQALLVGLPFNLLPIPEAPYILMNILSFSALCFFAWYVSKRFPDLPKWFIWIWLLTAPWEMQYGTSVVNPSYVAPFSVLFFTCVFDLLSIYDKPIINQKISFFSIALSTMCIMQLHLSWVVLIPFTVAAFYYLLKKKNMQVFYGIAAYTAGLIIGGVTLLPTLIHYGYKASGGTEHNIVFNTSNFSNFIVILTRYFSFASFEIPYMMGVDTPSRLAVVRENLWMAPVVLVLLVTGWIQVGYFILSFFFSGSNDWKKVKLITILTYLFLFISYFFSIKGPSSHTFYIILPLPMFYSFYCYSRLLQKSRRWEKVFAVLLVLGIFFHVGMAKYRFDNGYSLYKDRPLVAKAINEKNYQVLGRTRADDWGYGY